ncbi:MAG: Na/Pi symporter [Cyclobacteriaceae bacterium]|nr:Na/Pi symporter [Cyclobacteriaceae bacterium]UYN88626.1 MAG: Na/Pi symporter [Cyclobacteriaceae bacterium]
MFVFALDLMISSLQNLGSTAAEAILLATSNPFTALFIGLLITAMIQSSSTATSLVVALVASGSITIDSAIPIIMGANIGTTITSTIVSLGFINKKKEFRRAVAAGTYHDFFNILTVSILFPLEYYNGFLSNLSGWITENFFTISKGGASANFSPLWSGFSPIIDFLVKIIPSGFLLALFSFGLLFLSILLFRKLISGLLMASSPEKFSRFFFKNTLKSFFWGLVTTAAIRSSTITTSVVVPIVAQKIITLRKAVPFILGANMGTTVTAIIAAALSANTASAITIAMAHFLFNLIGVLVFYPLPILRNIPVAMANGLGRLTIRYRLAGFVYILVVFFFIPFSLIYLNKDSTEVLELTYKKTNVITGEESSYRIVSKQQKRSQSGEWLIYRRNKIDPDEIFPVYKKNTVLFINKEMILFNEPGFCWDGENKEGKYQLCVKEVLPKLTLGETLSFDSVYVYTQRYYHHPDSASSTVYVSALYPVVLQTIRQEKNVVIETRKITSFNRK